MLPPKSYDVSSREIISVTKGGVISTRARFRKPVLEKEDRDPKMAAGTTLSGSGGAHDGSE